MIESHDAQPINRRLMRESSSVKVAVSVWPAGLLALPVGFFFGVVSVCMATPIKPSARPIGRHAWREAG
jgi:hypothetical protein